VVVGHVGGVYRNIRGFGPPAQCWLSDRRGRGPTIGPMDRLRLGVGEAAGGLAHDPPNIRSVQFVL